MFLHSGEGLAQSADHVQGMNSAKKGLLPNLVVWGLLTTCALVPPGGGVLSTPGRPHPAAALLASFLGQVLWCIRCTCLGQSGLHPCCREPWE